MYAVQPICHESAVFYFKFIKICLHHDLSTHLESAGHVMEWRGGGGGCESFDLTGTLNLYFNVWDP